MSISLYKKIFLSVLFLLPVYLYAADSNMTLVLDPEAPGPYEQVKVSVQSYSFDVNTAYIEWTVNGVPFTSGLGIKSIQVTTGVIGRSIPISVKVSNRDGEVLESTTNLSAQNVELVWESIESYVPPFYEGKALPGEGSLVKITALPNFSDGGALVSASNLSFLWYMNDTYLESASGIGKQAVTIPLDILSDQTQVRVRVRSTFNAVAEKTITLYPHVVLPTLYMYDDILGIAREKAIRDRFETTKDFTLSISPYYLSTRNGMDTSSSYEWLLDGLPVTPVEKTILSFRPKENTYGTKKLSLLVSNTKRTLQNARNNLEIIFDTRK